MQKNFLVLTAMIIFYSCTKEVTDVNSKASFSTSENESATADTIKNERAFILFWSGNKNLLHEDDFYAAARRQAVLVFDDGTRLRVNHSENPFNRVYISRGYFGIGLNVIWAGDGFCTPNFKLLNWVIMDVKSGSNTLRLRNIDANKTAVVYLGTPLPSLCGKSIVEIDFKKFP
jgi:hypothetical protein